MLKVGDKLLCKKKDRHCHCGKYYYISKINDSGLYTIVMSTIKNYIVVEKDCYSLKKESTYYILDYFYTPQEIRKMKLERLKQC